MATKQTLVLGASENPSRYGYLATQMLREYDHPVWAVGIREGQVGDVHITTKIPPDQPVDTVTLYLNQANQAEYTDQILQLKPRRVIFNPGTENPEFEEQLRAAGIETVEACTLVMLRSGQY